MGVEPPPSRHDFNAPPRLMGARNQIVGGILFGLAYFVAFTLHGYFLPGLVGGFLGGMLLYLILKEADARKQRRWAARQEAVSQERSEGSGSIG